MKNGANPSNISNQLINCNQNLPKESCLKITTVSNIKQATGKNEKNKITKPKLIINKISNMSYFKKMYELDIKKVDELSAKEQECRVKFKEIFNKIKKAPMSPKKDININSDIFSESELIVQKMKRKLKQIFGQVFKEPALKLEKTVAKKQSNNINCVRSKPIEPTLYQRFTSWLLPINRNASSTCKSIDFISEPVSNNEQMVLFSKCSKLESKSNKLQSKNRKTIENIVPVGKKEDIKEEEIKKAVNMSKDDKIWETKEQVKPLKIDRSPENNFDIVEPNTENVTKNDVGGIRPNTAKKFTFNPKYWFSSKNNNKQNKMMPLASSSKVPSKWRYGFVILGTIIPLYYTYHKIVTNNKVSNIGD